MTLDMFEIEVSVTYLAVGHNEPVISFQEIIHDVFASDPVHVLLRCHLIQSMVYSILSRLEGVPSNLYRLPVGSHMDTYLWGHSQHLGQLIVVFDDWAKTNYCTDAGTGRPFVAFTLGPMPSWRAHQVLFVVFILSLYLMEPGKS